MRNATFPARLLLLALLLLCFAAPTAAGDTPAERMSLKGITDIQLLIEPIGPDAERDGLTTAQLEADIELRLRQAGLTVRSLANDVLQVQALTVKHPDGGLYAFNVAVLFHQVVVPYRHIQNQTQLPAVTWSLTTVGLVPVANLREVRARVAGMVDAFVSAYREQNPGR